MSQKESEWEEQLKRLQMALYVSVPADVAEDACKRINTIITAAVSTREKEIAEEVEKLSEKNLERLNYKGNRMTTGQTWYQNALKDVLKILKH